MKKSKKLSLTLVLFAFGLGCNIKTPLTPGTQPEPNASAEVSLTSDEKLITILQTNDIHGGVEPMTTKAGEKVGGMAIFSGIVQAIKAGLKEKYADNAGVLLVDGGDQFQGTLLSNFNEGQLVFDIMNAIGYDAAVLGNHDFDFGPAGWLHDKVSDETEDKDPRGALKKLVARKNKDFKLISANIYYTSSIVKKSKKEGEYETVSVQGEGCKPKTAEEGNKILWDKAQRLELAEPYTIKEIAGVRVALIGLDNTGTPVTTTQENVADLCFRDEVDTYLEVREELEGKADIFVLVTHNGNTNNDSGMNEIVKNILARAKNKKTVLHAVAAGHTHFLNQIQVENVPIIQSKANGQYFGRIDLVWDTKTQQVLTEKTKYDAGIYMLYDECPESKPLGCSDQKKPPKLFYEGVEVQADSKIEKLIADRRIDIAPLAGQKLGRANGVLDRDYYKENAMADHISDSFRGMMIQNYPEILKDKNVIAMMNGGGIRANLGPGLFTYEDLYRVFPFNNRLALKGPVSLNSLVKIVKKAIDTCGSRGALFPSGIRIQFNRECTKTSPYPKKSELLKIELLDGTVVYDAAQMNSMQSNSEFWIATFDFLANGGSGYSEFKDMPTYTLSSPQGSVGLIFREALKDYFLLNPPNFDAQIDDRLDNLLDEITPKLLKPDEVGQIFWQN